MGRIKTLRQNILSILAARGLDVSQTVRDAVLSCDDPDVLDRWLLATATATAADDILSAG